MENTIFEELIVVKRSGQRVIFNQTKVVLAIKNAFDSIDSKYSEADVNKVYSKVLNYICTTYNGRKTINVEDIQDIIEEQLKTTNYNDVYKSFNSYRLRRAASREVFSIKQQHKFVKAIENLGLQSNTSIYDQPLNVMFGFGKTISKEFAKAYLLENKYVRSHDEGIIYIHDLSYYPLYTTSSTHLDFTSIEANDVLEYLNKIVNINLECKQEQTGEHGINSLDKLLVKPLINNFKLIYIRNLTNYLKLNGFIDYINIKQVLTLIDKLNTIQFSSDVFNSYILNKNVKEIFDIAYSDSQYESKMILNKSIKDMLITLDGCESNINNKKTVISIGINDSYESKLITNEYLKVIDELNVLNNVTTIYKMDTIDSLIVKIISENKNISLSFNHNAEYFSKGEKIYSNINDDILSSIGRGVLSTTSINLSRIALINQNKPIDKFYKDLFDTLDLTKNQLIQRFELQANKYKKNFPNLFKYNLLLDSDKLDESQKIRKVIKNGVLNIGLVGIYECANILDSKNNKKVMLDILKFINDKVIQFTNENKLNFIISLTEKENVLKQLIAIDKSIYGSKYFDSNSYSLINNIDVEDLDNYNNLQDLINMRITVYMRKNSSEKKIVDTINKIRGKGILYFRIRMGKDDN